MQRHRKRKIRCSDFAGDVEGLVALDLEVEALKRQLSRISLFAVALAFQEALVELVDVALSLVSRVHLAWVCVVGSEVLSK